VAEQAKNYRFFQNKACEYFPCHQGIPEEDFNCLFCFCPLYALGKRCGGNFTYTEKGRKSCKNCSLPHRREHYDTVMDRYDEILSVVERMDREDV